MKLMPIVGKSQSTSSCLNGDDRNSKNINLSFGMNVENNLQLTRLKMFWTKLGFSPEQIHVALDKLRAIDSPLTFEMKNISTDAVRIKSLSEDIFESNGVETCSQDKAHYKLSKGKLQYDFSQYITMLCSDGESLDITSPAQFVASIKSKHIPYFEKLLKAHDDLKSL